MKRCILNYCKWDLNVWMRWWNGIIWKSNAKVSKNMIKHAKLVWKYWILILANSKQTNNKLTSSNAYHNNKCICNLVLPFGITIWYLYNKKNYFSKQQKCNFELLSFHLTISLHIIHFSINIILLLIQWFSLDQIITIILMAIIKARDKIDLTNGRCMIQITPLQCNNPFKCLTI